MISKALFTRLLMDGLVLERMLYTYTCRVGTSALRLNKVFKPRKITFNHSFRSDVYIPWIRPLNACLQVASNCRSYLRACFYGNPLHTILSTHSTWRHNAPNDCMRASAAAVASRSSSIARRLLWWPETLARITYLLRSLGVRLTHLANVQTRPDIRQTINQST
jgi:hypothetical protein